MDLRQVTLVFSFAMPLNAKTTNLFARCFYLKRLMCTTRRICLAPYFVFMLSGMFVYFITLRLVIELYFWIPVRWTLKITQAIFLDYIKGKWELPNSVKWRKKGATKGPKLAFIAHLAIFVPFVSPFLSFARVG